jgi:hypothetical protein
MSDRATTYPLADALLNRRSRRFAKGMRLDGGPLAYASRAAPEPLSLEEEAALAFAACGVTGPILGELPFDSSAESGAGGGNILVNLVGRTVASGDAAHVTAVFVVNDEGAWFLKRPQDFPRGELPELVRAARERRWVDLYLKSRVRIADKRLEIPRRWPYTPPFNVCSANVPGATYFVPIAELSGLWVNVLLAALGAEIAQFFVDDRNRFRPAGLAPFARSRGGHLDDDPAHGRIATLGYLDDWILEFAAVEQGAILQNLGLMTEALGLGGFAHFAAYPGIWCEVLGFRMENLPFSRTIGAGPVARAVLGLLGRDLPVPNPLGLEHEDEALLKPYCPPYYKDMEEAVHALVAHKFAPGTGVFRDGGAGTAWRDPARVQSGIPAYSDRNVAAAVAVCEYAYRRYGRIPPGTGPLRTVLAFQAHRLDPEFYGAFYADR